MKDSSLPTPEVPLPDRTIDRLVDPIVRFLQVESAAGAVLLLATVAALTLANSPWSNLVASLWQTPAGFSIGPFGMYDTVRQWINDGLMVIFFFVVGLEIKRELVLGELRDRRVAALPIAAAFGGMVVPAALYLAAQWGEAGQRGWGIPMATDIAFVVGGLALVGSRVPRSLRVLLLSLAIADDVGAILVIAIGYTTTLSLPALAGGGLGLGLVMLCQRLGVRSVAVYVVLGVGVWYGFYQSGVHATIAGVLLGFITPAEPLVSPVRFTRFARQVGRYLQGDSWQVAAQRQAMLQSVKQAARETMAPLERLEAVLHPWVGFLIMPLFAFVNAGVPLDPELFRDSVASAVVIGLCVGKPAGIVLFSWLAVRTGVAKLPKGISWSLLGAGGALAGIGFTMSLFIAGLALKSDLLLAAKIGILVGSGVSAVVGLALLYWLAPKRSQPSGV